MRGANRIDEHLYYDLKYVSSITTPSHRADFILSDRDDYVGDNGVRPQRLDEIILYVRDGDGDRRVRRVVI